MDYAAALRYLYAHADLERGIGYAPGAPPRFTLDRIAALLQHLGNPHQAFASVHIAGSKGKGSTAAMLEAIVRAAGLRTGLYTQPHLHTFRERVCLDGQPLTPEQFVRYTEAVRRAATAMAKATLELGEPTTFELATALGFLAFAEAGVDMAVVEVGLGGRLDATNVLSPRVAVITTIALEHTAILGDTLPAIAREKAGIVKPGGVLVHAPGPPDVVAVFAEVCRARGAVIQVGDPARCLPVSPSPPCSPENWGQSCRLRLPSGEAVVRLPLLGAHQRLNCSVVLSVVDELVRQGVALPAEAVVKGLSHVRWPGRLELLAASPLVIADGAHTPDAVRVALAALAEHFPGRQLHLVFGTSADKDLPAMVQALLPHAASLTVTRSRHPRASRTERILATLPMPYPVAVRADPTVHQALLLALARAAPEDIICATGSLFVAAEAREAFGLAGAEDPPVPLGR